MNNPLAVGIDFGTTNSAVAVVRPDGAIEVARFPAFGGVSIHERAGGASPTSVGRQPTNDYYRSVIFFEPPEAGRAVPGFKAGPEAMAAYIDGEEGRLMQSLKSFLPSKLVSRTQVFNRMYGFEEILGAFLKRLRAAAEARLGPLGTRAVVGRPVRFVKDAEDDDHPDALAEDRLRRAFALAGFTEIELCFEPVAAALAYEARLTAIGERAEGASGTSVGRQPGGVSIGERAEGASGTSVGRQPGGVSIGRSAVVLVGDFGGGTSDFSVMRMGADRGVLATVGVPLAGDRFDARIVHHVVAPKLGFGSHYRRGALAGDKPLPMPLWIYKNLERWHHLSFLRERETMHLLREIAGGSDAPEAIEGLMTLVRENLGFHLYRSVEATKVALSLQDVAEFNFDHAGLHLQSTVRRSDFEAWIAPELQEICDGIDLALSRAGLVAQDVERVFLTGGTAFVPAVRRLFIERFGEARISGGQELTSVVYGLAAQAGAAAGGR